MNRLVFTLILTAFLLPNALKAYEIPDLGNPSLDQKTQPAWQHLAEAFAKEIRGSKLRLADPISESYLTKLTERIAGSKVADATTLYVINSPSINAFAGPGEIIVLHAGLFEEAADENELAAVLAHEIAHQEQHHLWRGMQHQKDLQVPVALGTMVAVALGMVNPILGQSAFGAGATMLENSELQFSRAFEQEADRIGITYLAKSGFDARSVAEFFSRLNAHEKYTMQSSVPEILRSHPVTEKRIADALNHASSLPNQHPASSLDFQLIKARLHILSTPFQRTEVERYRHITHKTIADEYGYAIALFKTQQVPESIALLQHLRESHPDNTILALTLAAEYGASQQDDKANQLFAELRQRFPENKIVAIASAKAFYDQEQFDHVIALLNQENQKSNLNAIGHEILAEAYGHKQQLALAYYHQAEAMKLLSFQKQARLYYQKAKKQTHDTVLIAKIDHALRVMA